MSSLAPRDSLFNTTILTILRGGTPVQKIAPLVRQASSRSRAGARTWRSTMAAPQALVGGSRSKAGEALDASLTAAIKACASEVWKHEALRTTA